VSLKFQRTYGLIRIGKRLGLLLKLLCDNSSSVQMKKDEESSNHRLFAPPHPPTGRGFRSAAIG
jgi:hypothetical protein